MSETKACNLTKDEVEALIGCHAMGLHSRIGEIDDHIERINYLNKRLKSFEDKVEQQPTTEATEPEPASEYKQVAQTPASSGWGNPV